MNHNREEEMFQKFLWGRDKFREIMSKYSDEELDRMAAEHWGPIELFAHLMMESIMTPQIDKIKADLKKRVRWILLSPEVEEYIADKRDKSIIENSWVSMQCWKDDRFWVNNDNVIANFIFDNSIELPYSKHEKLDRFWVEIAKPENEVVWDFLMRTPEEYLKLMIYYLKVKSFKDLNRIFDAFENKKEEIQKSFSGRWYNHHEMVYFEECLHAPTEFMVWMSWARMEAIFRTAKLSSIDDFIKLFINTPYMYNVLTTINIDIFNYIVQKIGINNIDWLISLFEEKENRRVTRLDVYWDAVKNVIYLLDHFQVTTIGDIAKVIHSEWVNFLVNKANEYNFKTLITTSGITTLEEFESKCDIPYIRENIENSFYEILVNLVDALGIDWIEKNHLIFWMISNYYNREIGEACLWIINIIKKENHREVKDFVLDILLHWDNKIEIMQVLWDLIKEHWEDLKKCDYKRLIRLRKYMDWCITVYLAKEILLTDNVDELLTSWDKTIKTFKKWKFDHTNELHKNLEYKRFKKTVNHENIQKYMKHHFSVYNYFQIYDEKRNIWNNQFSERDRFEIECVAYEAKLLKQYILEVKKTADRIGRKVLVIPNLSYWYLPTAPIYEELLSEWVEFIIWAKVGSTECHNNTSVINSRLFKNHRTKIIQEQPIIIVIDWTSHITDRDWWESKKARYPDAYQWYLNQIIAINDGIQHEKKDEEKWQYEFTWKTSYQLKWLRWNQEFQRTVEIYKKLGEWNNQSPYSFEFWNTAWMELIIRTERERVNNLKPFEPNRIHWPTMIFCNIWVLHSQLPEELKKKQKRDEHIPAYFDDSWRIVNFEFTYNEYWVHYLNSLEDELKRAYWSHNGNIEDSTRTAAIIRFTAEQVKWAVWEWWEGREWEHK